MAKRAAEVLAEPYVDVQAKAKTALMGWMQAHGVPSVRSDAGQAYTAADSEVVTYDAAALDALCASSDEVARLLRPHRKVSQRKGAFTIR